jgi:predicted dehydrogenase
MSDKLNIAIVGLGFGAEFIPIYQRHPNTNMYAICQRTESRLNEIGAAFGVAKRYSSFDELIQDPALDAVHINSPIHMHAPQSIAALKAGKHVACTVPMATTVDECRQIVEAQRESGKKYMMMETVIYSREYLYVRELRDSGQLGRLQFLRAAHHQEMAGWPGYWEGLPPMHYATHVVSPCLALAAKDAEYVSCFGSGSIAANLVAKYGSPFAVESAHIRMYRSDLSAEVSRSLFETARQYVESFDAYGSRMSFEWQQLAGEAPIVFTGEEGRRVDVPDYARILPEPIRRFTTRGVYDADEHQHLSFIQGSGHGGSHPHLVHQFVMSIIEGREPYPNARQAANWTCVGILAHESAMKGGEIFKLPEFTLSATG